MADPQSAPKVMRQPFVRGCVGAEIKRARRYRRPIDRKFLREETGLPASVIEWLLEHEARRIYREALRARPV